ncbi:NAD(P)-dependent oxidoreductase [Seongchinamella unica]|uniref:NAD(P)-dependent oxidoreductase n=1 Tax=Seongchinamella unica TaxID=2547392 RepID=A0A4R5LNY6_9GAMM|nr:NAD(P)-dependent oxidoreductase [Seongchinamella unica]TDG11990.1 NAD(P)-dependent oxidoreductase [Seongchinamella unica]
MRLAFIGLGVMGYPMAGHLQRAGHEVCVYNRTGAKARDWVAEYGGHCADSPADAAAGAEICFLCVGNDDDVRSVVMGESGALAAMQPGAIIVDHTTASADLARELALNAEESALGFLDAPVSGGQAGAQNGALTVMVGGQREHFARVEPVMEAYARCVRLLGPAGSGQLAKMVNQICIAGIVQGLAEALEFSEQTGLDSAAVVEVISQGAAQSWQMDNRYQTMLAGEYEHGFAVDWMRKDLDMVLAEADRLGLELPVTELVDGYYGEVQAMGGGRWDTSSLFARMRAVSKPSSAQE